MSTDVRGELTMDLDNFYQHIHHPIINILETQLQAQTTNLHEVGNIMFYSQDLTLCVLHMYHFLAKCFNFEVSSLKTTDVVCNDFSTEFTYKTNKHFIEIDMDTCLNKEKTCMIEFIKSVSSIPHMFSKHVFVIINFDKTNKQQQSRLRCIIEKSFRNTLFLTQCCNISKIDNPLISRFDCIRIPTLKESQINGLVSHFVKDNTTIDGKKMKKLTTSINASSNVYISNIYFICKTNALVFGKKQNNNFAQVELQKLLDYLHKTTIYINAIVRIRTTLYLLLHYNIPPTYLIKIILNIVSCNVEKYFPTNPQAMHHIVHIVATLEHDLLLASKPVIHFEKAIIEVYMIMKKLN